MKVSFIDVYNPIPINSGGDWYRFQLLKDLSINHDVTEYFTYNIGNKKGFFPETVNFKAEHLSSKIPWFRVSKILEILKPDYFLNNHQCNNIHCDLVFFSTVCYHIASKIAKKNKSPTVLVMHNIEWQYLKNNKSKLWFFMKYYEHFIFNHTDYIIAISSRDYDYVQKIVPKKRVFYISPKINTEIFNPFDPSYNYGKDKFNVLFYGSLDRVQNIDALYFIINNLIPSLKEKKLMSSVRVNIFGSGNPPASINLQENEDINFLGTVENPGNYVRGADVVIVPLKNSGGVKIRVLEALVCKKFVIASREAVEGLPAEVQNMVYIGDDTNKFVELIDDIKNQKLANKVDDNNIKKLLLNDSVEDVINCIKMKYIMTKPLL